MRIRLTTARTCWGSSQRPGDTIDLPEDEARRLVAAGAAEPAAAETAATEPTENAARPAPRVRRASRS